MNINMMDFMTRPLGGSWLVGYKYGVHEGMDMGGVQKKVLKFVDPQINLEAKS